MEEKSKKIVPKEKDDSHRIMVVDKLPTQTVREIEENGITYNLITVEEYLTELANK